MNVIVPSHEGDGQMIGASVVRVHQRDATRKGGLSRCLFKVRIISSDVNRVYRPSMEDGELVALVHDGHDGCLSSCLDATLTWHRNGAAELEKNTEIASDYQKKRQTLRFQAMEFSQNQASVRHRS